MVCNAYFYQLVGAPKMAVVVEDCRVELAIFLVPHVKDLLGLTGASILSTDHTGVGDITGAMEEQDKLRFAELK